MKFIALFCLIISSQTLLADTYQVLDLDMLEKCIDGICIIDDYVDTSIEAENDTIKDIPNEPETNLVEDSVPDNVKDEIKDTEDMSDIEYLIYSITGLTFSGILAKLSYVIYKSKKFQSILAIFKNKDLAEPYEKVNQLTLNQRYKLLLKNKNRNKE